MAEADANLIDVEKLLRPISQNAPSGVNLADTAPFIAAQRLTQKQPKLDQQGKRIADEFVDPDWQKVQDECLKLLAQSRDLRLLVYVTTAQTHLRQIPGLRDGLKLIKGAIEQYWETFFPRLDPAESNDPTERMNILREFASREVNGPESSMVKLLRETPLAAPAKGAPSLKDLQAGGPGAAAAFARSDSSFLAAQFNAAQESIELVQRLSALLDEKVGAANSVDFKDFNDLLKEVVRVLTLPVTGVNPDAATTTPAVEDSTTASATSAGGPSLTGDIRSRDDVLRAIDKICEFYARTEPSSPVPLILQRARRLVGKDFWSLLMDLVPGSSDTFRTISGSEPPSPDGNAS